jgi:hypothetical protein
MAAQVKRFKDHSPRWQRDALRKGIDPAKWDRWRKLSPKIRRATNPTDYASGVSVRAQLRTPLLNAATNKLLAIHRVRGATRYDNSPIRFAAVKRNLDHPDAGMTNAKLRRIVAMSPQKLVAEVDDSLSRRYGAGERSPFWYEKRG